MKWHDTSCTTIRRFFKAGFTAADMAEALVSFDADRPAERVRAFMETHNLAAVGVRRDGIVAGYLTSDVSTDGICGDHASPFENAIVVEDATPLHLVVPMLDEEPCVFVSALGAASGIVTREDVEKPPVRMWLFGLLTLIEMAFSHLIQNRFPGDTWREIIRRGRLARAVTLQKDRAHRDQKRSLVDCLHLVDKANIVFRDPELRERFGFPSRTAAQRAISIAVELRNDLTHAHEIVPDNWEAIVQFSTNVDRLLDLIDV